MWTESSLVRGVLDSLRDGVFFVNLEGRITYWNEAAELITGIPAKEAVGRLCRELLLHIDENGAELCAKDCRMACSAHHESGWQQAVYLRHARGHRVPVAVRVTPMRDDKGTILGRMEVFSDLSAEVEAMSRARELERLAHVDPLTGIGNKRSGERVLRSRLEESNRYGISVGVLLLDVDGLKDVNDRYGHEAGDELLKGIAGTIEMNLRSSDFAARWGGDEFLIVVPAVQDDCLLTVAERFKALIQNTRVELHAASIGATVSVGATLAHRRDDIPGILARADRLMYASKKAGGNRVTMEDGSSPEASRSPERSPGAESPRGRRG